MNKRELVDKYFESSKIKQKLGDFVGAMLSQITADPSDFLSEDEFKKVQDAVQKAKDKFNAELPKFLEDNYVTPLETEFTEEELTSLISYLESDLGKKAESFNTKMSELIKAPSEAWLQTIFKESFEGIF